MPCPPGSEPCATPFTPARRLRMLDDVFLQLRAAILAGEVAEGQRLPNERDLAERFEVGRPTVPRGAALARGAGHGRDPRGRSGGAFAARPSEATLGGALDARRPAGSERPGAGGVPARLRGRHRPGGLRGAPTPTTSQSSSGSSPRRDDGWSRSRTTATPLTEADARWHQALAHATRDRLRVGISLGLHQPFLRQVPALGEAHARYAGTIPTALADITRAVAAHDADAARGGMTRVTSRQWARLNPASTSARQDACGSRPCRSRRGSRRRSGSATSCARRRPTCSCGSRRGRTRRLRRGVPGTAAHGGDAGVGRRARRAARRAGARRRRTRVAGAAARAASPSGSSRRHSPGRGRHGAARPRRQARSASPCTSCSAAAIGDAIEVHGSVGWDADPERVADTAEQQAPEFRWLKLYAGTGTLEDDLGRIAAARRRVGDEHPFLLDVNGLWSPLQAIAAGPVLRELGVAAVEQPVAAADDDGQARVAAVYAERHQIARDRGRAGARGLRRPPGGGHGCRPQASGVGVSKMGGIVAAFDAAATARSALSRRRGGQRRRARRGDRCRLAACRGAAGASLPELPDRLAQVRAPDHVAADRDRRQPARHRRGAGSRRRGRRGGRGGDGPARPA